jgi:sulfoxide reductase heme-binding subunit YedZ
MKKLLWPKAALILLLAGPLANLVYLGWHDGLSADPVEFVLHYTGLWALRLLLLTLAISPLRELLGLPVLVRFRRILGVATWFYATLHFAVYLVLDLQLDFAHLGEDILKRPYITVGFLAWLLMTPLALTSSNRAVRALGRRWKKLHRLIYLIVLLACLHFIWLVKADLLEPLIYTAIALGLLFYRLIRASRQR